jgi:hypothetical protein
LFEFYLRFNLNTCTYFVLTGSLIFVMNLLIISGIKMYRKLPSYLTLSASSRLGSFLYQEEIQLWVHSCFSILIDMCFNKIFLKLISFAKVSWWDYINGCLLHTCQVRDTVASWSVTQHLSRRTLYTFFLFTSFQYYSLLLYVTVLELIADGRA